MRLCCGKRPLSEKKKVMSTRGSATIERIMWLGENHEVDRANRRVACRETRVAVQRVVHDIADQKERRETEGQQHAGAMRFAVAFS